MTMTTETPAADTAQLTADDNALQVLLTYGPDAFTEFAQVLPEHREQTLTWLNTLAHADDETFTRMATTALLDSTPAIAFAGNWYHEHVKATAAQADSYRRAYESGHATGCEHHSLYHQAWRNAFRQGTGEDPEPRPQCACA